MVSLSNPALGGSTKTVENLKMFKLISFNLLNFLTPLSACAVSAEFSLIKSIFDILFSLQLILAF